MPINNEKQPLVSVGIPTYNRAATLVKAIESVLQQTYSNIELIISDNASTDETQSICEKFCNLDQRITYIRQEKNLGAANNFNTVLEFAKGEYFMWLGDDDWISSMYIEECIGILSLNLGYSLVSGTVSYFVGNKYLGEGKHINLEQNDRYDRVIRYYDQVTDNGVFYGVMNREQILSISMRNTLGADLLMIAAMAFLGKVKTLKNVSLRRESRENEGLETLVKRLGLSQFHAKYPTLSYTISASSDVFINSSYKHLALNQKMLLFIKITSFFVFYRLLPHTRNSLVSFIASITPKLLYPYFRRVYRILQTILCKL
ncbi:glycosyltransferase family 2 protein [Pseudanabaena sp. FACHB-1277]|uniref:Glycosyltransferase family 2 protein n=1 Tax=Pseudanabaena cinerea FACHB-1277 TaxID=2949581 RepID=A0A926Z7S1_9CYAN|nr:glycosyltransferase family 2 protein [Pseudanabaena cinerea]MBD2150274.1 glycosyltransferase family 2 protein [Pseudanabaena cinerea FACHB-1277]